MNIIEGIVGAISGGRRAPAPSTEASTPKGPPLGSSTAASAEKPVEVGALVDLLRSEGFLALPCVERVSIIKKHVPAVLQRPPLSFAIELGRRAESGAILPDDDVKRLVELQRQFDNLTSLMVQLANAKTKEQLARQHAEMVSQLAAGDLESFLQRDAWSREEFERERLLKVRSVKAQRRALSHQVIPLAEKAAVATARLAMKLHREESQATAARLASWGLGYTPTAIEQSLVDIAVEALCSIPTSDVTVDPRSVLVLAQFLQTQPAVP